MIDLFIAMISSIFSSFMEGERRHRRKTIVERRKSMAAGEDPPEFSATYYNHGESDSRERRLSQAVVDFMQKKRGSEADVSATSGWRRVSGAMSKGLLAGDASRRASGANFLTANNGANRPRANSYDAADRRSPQAKQEQERLPVIAPRRRASMVSMLAPSRTPLSSRRSSVMPVLPAINVEGDSDADDDDDDDGEIVDW